MINQHGLLYKYDTEFVYNHISLYKSHFDITLVNNIVYLPCMKRLDLFVKVKSFEASGDRF